MGGVTTAHIWDGANISAEYVGSAVTAKYVRGINLIYADRAGTKSYYLYNAHGDVVQLADGSGNETKTYDYDAFGNERSPVTGDANPWRYCGEYYDAETGTIYLRARYYNPATGRFMTEDPIRDGMNWYVYCNSNPIMYHDPSGCIILLPTAENKSKKQSQDEILAMLQELTDHTLGVSDNGELYVKEYATDNLKYKNGNELIDRMIKNDHSVEIKISYTQKSAYEPYDTFVISDPKIGGGGKITVNPLRKSQYATLVDPKTGNVNIIDTDKSGYIALAHELIHADRAMRGVAMEYYSDNTYNFKYQISRKRESFLFFSWWKYEYNTQIVHKEELATIGLKYNKKGDITENNIRAEHDLLLRGLY